MTKKEPLKPKIDLSFTQIIIFDMDGTLYRLDGDKNGFINSTLQKVVLENLINFIATKEDCDALTAKQYTEECTNLNKTFSDFFSKRYGFSRDQYFDHVWQIDPSSILLDYKKIPKLVRQLREIGYRLFLVTGSPKVWQTKVIEFLGLSEIFERIYTTEMFVSKEELFKQLAEEFEPSSILSIGDQPDTDLIPAERLGFRTMYVSSPKDLQLLTK